MSGLYGNQQLTFVAVNPEAAILLANPWPLCDTEFIKPDALYTDHEYSALTLLKTYSKNEGSQAFFIIKVGLVQGFLQ